MNTKKQDTLPSFLNTEINTIAYFLFLATGSIMLSPQKVSIFTSRSEISLERDRAECRGIPHTKLGKQSGSDRVLYNVYDIGKFIVSRKSKVMS